jgi:hypothetical protein
MCLIDTEREASPIRFLSCAEFFGFVDLAFFVIFDVTLLTNVID